MMSITTPERAAESSTSSVNGLFLAQGTGVRKPRNVLRAGIAWLTCNRGTGVASASPCLHATKLGLILDRFSRLQVRCLADHSLGEANRRELTHQFERATKLPKELVEHASKTSTLAKAAWSEAREKDDFPLFAPSRLSCALSDWAPRVPRQMNWD